MHSGVPGKLARVREISVDGDRLLKGRGHMVRKQDVAVAQRHLTTCIIQLDRKCGPHMIAVDALQRNLGIQADWREPTGELKD